ncbi:FAD-dependent oxidoreductase [Planctomonas sp. JC2975]|uniref:NAD(P)/FAD-dependent oxidoreductase n=1 Tax=Planctomonas sp. JC2975 TaxID=2729626 RepID=UPI0014746807|nr:FAD-dependent oxidoreductase [Planctomonas sp. JC2975]NNC13833.1 FAD-dependent oxidoreductase [Planctomonas sp. JC2975]
MSAPGLHSPAPERPAVVVIGGGYSGAVAANRLRKRDDIDITLVNARAEFVDRIRLHQFVAGTGTATVDYATLLGDEVRLVVDRATRIDTGARRVELASGGSLHYDYVVYAVGSTGVVPSSVPGAVDHAAAVADLDSARRLRSTLDGLPVHAPITVVGGGLTGIETAAELAEQGRRVTIVSDGSLAGAASAAGRRYIVRWLERHGVTVIEHARVSAVERDSVTLADGTTRASALTVWAAGFGVPQLASASGLSTDDLGRLLTDETLTSVDDDRIVAAGDAAAPSGRALRMSCQAASPLGALAADTVLSRIAGADPAPIDFAFTGSCISLGRRVAMRQVARKDDTSMNLYIGGWISGRYKELTSRLGVWKIRREAHKPGSLFWPKGGPRSTWPTATRIPEPTAHSV